MERFEKFRYTLQNLRENRDVKQVEVANAIGIAPSSYSNYEQGLHMPDYTVLIKLADYFDVTLDYLLDRTETKLSWSKQSKIMDCLLQDHGTIRSGLIGRAEYPRQKYTVLYCRPPA